MNNYEKIAFQYGVKDSSYWDWVADVFNGNTIDGLYDWKKKKEKEQEIIQERVLLNYKRRRMSMPMSDVEWNLEDRWFPDDALLTADDEEDSYQFYLKHVEKHCGWWK